MIFVLFSLTILLLADLPKKKKKKASSLTTVLKERHWDFAWLRRVNWHVLKSTNLTLSNKQEVAEKNHSFVTRYLINAKNQSFFTSYPKPKKAI